MKKIETNKKMSSPNTHPNVNEHYNKPVKFIGLYIISGIIATILGGVIEKLVTYFQKDGELQPGKFNALFYLLLQLLLNGLAFYAMFRLITFSNKFGVITFDDWLSGTFQGIIFTTTFFSSQTNLPIYAANIFN